MHKSVIAAERISDAGLTNEELQRYSRHLIMPEVTVEDRNDLSQRVFCALAPVVWVPLQRCIWQQPVWDALGLSISGSIS